MADQNGAVVDNTALQSNLSPYVTQPSSTPTISSDNLKPVTPVTVPKPNPAPVDTTGATAASYMTPPAGTTTDQNGTATLPPPPTPDTTDTTRNNLMSQLTTDNTTLSTKGDVQNQLNTQFGVDSKQQAAIDAYNAFNKKKLEYQQQEAAIYDQPGISREAANAQVQELSRIHNADLANLAVTAQAAQGNYQGALDIVQRKLDAQFAPIQQRIDNAEKFLQLNNANLSDSQKITLQGKIDQQKQDAMNLYNAKLAAHQAAVQNHAPASVLSAIDSASDVQGTLQALGQYGQVNDWQITTDPSTGAAIAYNSKTNQSSPIGTGSNPFSTNTYTPTDPTKVISTPSGQRYDLTAYATDPQYATKIQSTMDKIGTITDANSAQAAISKLYPNSPITGQMIIDAANSASIDPTLFTAQLALESKLGTSTVAKVNNNTGGIKFIGQPNATMGTTSPEGDHYAKFNSLQDSLNTQAKLLASKYKIGDTNTSTQSNIPQQSTATAKASLDRYNTLVKNAPPVIRGLVNYINSTGDTYMSYSDSPLAANYAKNNGISMLPKGIEPSDIASLDTALSNLNQAKSLFQEIAPGGYFGKANNAAFNRFKIALGTPTGNKINTYINTTLPSAVGALKEIAGNARLANYTGNIAEQTLPQVAGNGKFAIFGGANASNTDTYASGIDKFNAITGQLNNALKAFLPNSSGAPLTTTQTDFSTVAPDGKTYTFKDQASLDAFKTKAGIK